MELSTLAANLAERAPLPDMVVRAGMRRVISSNDRKSPEAGWEEHFARAMADYPIAEHADLANAQHYELPAEFFALFLGPRRKYSCCLYPMGSEGLAAAEEAALAETVARAHIADGEDILELGCGWGSLTLWMAEKFPAARITAISNSASQRLYIEGQARSRNLRNVTIVTADMNEFATAAAYDRVVSVEMFEHMANWRALLSRARGWLKPNGTMFLHVFSHRERAARYDPRDKTDWIAQHFFTGGIMPSHGLIRQFPDLFVVEQEWRWSGTNYERTALQWLKNFDANRNRLEPILRDIYGARASLWRRRWRMFFLATAESFGFADGNSWCVSHYLLKPIF